MPPTTPDPAILRTVAPAKINWTLEVLGRRPDGYHEVRSVMQTISLEDELVLRIADRYELVQSGPEVTPVEQDENLVTRAARSFPDRLLARPVCFHLTKNIPAAAGVGGGSSDAAAALRLLGRFWRVRDGGIDRVAASVGSDVPFFLRGGTQLAASRGEHVTPLRSPPSQSLVLLMPPISVPNKTVRLYAEVTAAQYTDGRATEMLARKLEAGGVPAPEDYVNVFDAIADRVFPGLQDYRRLLQRLTGSRAMLAGAGPSLFALVKPLMLPEGRWRGGGLLDTKGARVWTVHTTGPTRPIGLTQQ
jgi:4-diphosphocytidyl-2-C-methyl-D-erythritol kinase